MTYLPFFLALAGLAASKPMPQGVTVAIAPSASAPSGCSLSYSGTFGIAVVAITGGSSATATQAADGQAAVSQISDGQIQAATATAKAVSQISDGQVQAGTATAKAVSQISDGQIQAGKGAAVITQISDGQIQAPTATKTMRVITQIGDGQVQAPTAPVGVITQISDGQIQAPKTATAKAVSQISDGQIQAPKSATAKAVTQISDGQIQAPTASAVSQISDGQTQSNSTSTSSSTTMAACLTNSTLALTLKNGVLLDSQGRTGYIAANYQFQFDKPAQTGAIYTSGFSVCSNGSLALGGSTVWYQCLSGDFYNLYNENWAPQCEAVNIEVVKLVSC